MSKLTADALERSLAAAVEILRSRTDSSEYKHHLLGMFLLRYLNDRFLDAREALEAELRADGSEDALVAEELEKPEWYADTFFLPKEARWSDAHGADLGEGIADIAAGSAVAARLDRAFEALEEANAQHLAGVLTAVRFRAQSASRQIPEDALLELVEQLDKVSLREADLAFPELVGVVTDRVLEGFAEAGKKGAESFTPSWAARLLVRLLDVEPAMSVYDPSVGTGGVLVAAWKQVQGMLAPQRGPELALAGQERDELAWALCKMNLILHGIDGADLVCGDTLAQPGHVETQGEEGAEETRAVRRFDRVVADPPFGFDYKSKDLALVERFPVLLPETGKRADLMFVQHMVASLSSKEEGDEQDGRLVVLVPQGALSRGKQERQARQSLVDEGLIEAVISLPSNLLQGSAAILVLSREGRTERDHVLMIDAGSEHRGKDLPSEDLEKIVAVCKEQSSIEGFSKKVALAALQEAEYNLDPRRYVDTGRGVEAHDVVAHLHGGLPEAEIAALDRWLKNYAGLRKVLFQAGPDGGHARLADGVEQDIESSIAAAKGVVASQEKLLAAADKWWEATKPDLASLAETKDVYGLERRLIESLPEALQKHTLLTGHQVRGVLQRFFEHHDSTMKTIASSGWVAALIPGEVILTSQRPELLGKLEEKKTRIGELEALFSDAKSREEAGETGEEDNDSGVLSPSEAKSLKERQKSVKSELGGLIKHAKMLVTLVYGKMQRWGGSPPKEYTKGLTPQAPDFSGAVRLLDEVGENPDVQSHADELQKLIAKGERLGEENQTLEQSLSAHKTAEAELRQLKSDVREMGEGMDLVVEEARAQMEPTTIQGLVLDRLGSDFRSELSSALERERGQLASAVRALVEKYSDPLHALEKRRSERLSAALSQVEENGATRDEAFLETLDALIADSDAVLAKLRLLKAGLTTGAGVGEGG